MGVLSASVTWKASLPEPSMLIRRKRWFVVLDLFRLLASSFSRHGRSEQPVVAMDIVKATESANVIHHHRKIKSINWQ